MRVFQVQKGNTIMEEDPICGLDIDSSQAIYMAVFRGVEYYFCSAACRDCFNMNPERYAIKQAA